MAQDEDTHEMVQFYAKGYDLASNIPTINAALDFLLTFTDQNVLLENERAYSAIEYLYSMTASHVSKGDDLINIYFNMNFPQFLYNSIENLSLICNTLKHHTSEEYTPSDQVKNKILSDVLEILNFLTVYSLPMRIKYFEMGGTKALLRMLDADVFVRNFHGDALFTRIVANVNWMSKVSDMFKAEWNELNAIDVLIKVARNYPMSKLVAYMTFANVANDKQIDSSPDIHTMLPELIDIIRRASKNMTDGNAVREKQPFIEEDEGTNQLYDVYIVPVQEYNTRFTVTGVLLALYKLAVNNTIKYDMYVKYNLREPLRNIIFIGSEIEKKYTIQVLAQLCFDNQVLDLVSKDDELRGVLESKTKAENCSMKSMRKLCEQITWTITMKNKKMSEETNQRLGEDREQKQVMISYNSGSRDLCLKIKEDLEKNGYRVWIDINEIHGSSLDSMARAVESSDFILIAITEKYRQSVNCQAEAQYAFKLKKKIIPLIMQKGYENVDGWLGIIMGDKIFVNFNKYPFEQCIQIMLKELTLSINASKQPRRPSIVQQENATQPAAAVTEQPPKITITQTFSKLPSVKGWTEEQVSNWLNEKRVPEHIQNILKPCNGEVLYQLYKLRSSAPEFYFQSLSKTCNLDLKSILVFSNDLEKLFEST